MKNLMDQVRSDATSSCLRLAEHECSWYTFWAGMAAQVAWTSAIPFRLEAKFHRSEFGYVGIHLLACLIQLKLMRSARTVIEVSGDRKLLLLISIER